MDRSRRWDKNNRYCPRKRRSKASESVDGNNNKKGEHCRNVENNENGEKVAARKDVDNEKVTNEHESQQNVENGDKKGKQH